MKSCLFCPVSGVCVQVSLQIHAQVVKMKRSCEVKADSDPCFSYRMTFKLRSQHLDEACLRFELQQPSNVQSGDRRPFKGGKKKTLLLRI